ncbi:IS110 family transposase, partial [Rhizobium phaseoli]|nr:IS110 family transposase [Rhizobium phaseoli]
MDMNESVVVGIDVSKDRLDVALHPSGEHFAVSNDHAGLEELIARLGASRPTIVGLEAPGGYEM